MTASDLGAKNASAGSANATVNANANGNGNGNGNAIGNANTLNGGPPNVSTVSFPRPVHTNSPSHGGHMSTLHHGAAASSQSPMTPGQEVVSLRAIDGKASIEHLVSIHVQDLFDIAGNNEVTAGDVLAGLRYLMVYRIRGGKMPSLDADVMRRLAESLLLNMGTRAGDTAAAQSGGAVKRVLRHHLLGKKLSPEAQEAFCLFAEWLEEVEEFRVAVAAKPVADLRHYLRIHLRVKASADVQEMVVRLLRLLPEISPQFGDWRELVVDDAWDDVETLLAQFANLPVRQLAPSKDRLFPPPDLYFDRTVKKVVYMFKTSLERGLEASSIEAIREHYGRNMLPEPPKRSIPKMLWAQLTDFMVVILIIASIVEFILQENGPGIVLLVVVAMNVVIGFTQELKATQALEALTSLSVPQARVIRDGSTLQIDSRELVPGDVVILEEGDSVPADLRIVDSAQLEVIEVILTGEPIGILKSPDAIKHSSRRMPLGECKGNAFMATVVARGRGKGVVVRTGMRTEVGKISSAITSTPHVDTPIQKKLARLGFLLVIVAFLLCAAVVIIGVAWGRPIGPMIKAGISLAVSVIPEGLVAVVTVTMALGVRRMARQSAIVRKLPSVETLGSVTTICSDKTGTLTEGKMGSQELWTAADEGHYKFTRSTEIDPSVGEFQAMNDQERIATENMTAHARLSMMIASLCNNSTVSRDPETQEYKAVGDSTEVALFVAAQKAGLGASELSAKKVDGLLGGWERVGENAFDSDRKVMSVVYKHPNHANWTVLAKGAPEGVLKRCTGVVSSFNAETGALEVSDLTDTVVDKISGAAAKMAAKGLRVLGLAARTCPVDSKVSSIECQWAIVGLIGLIDPPRQGVRESVARCKAAGIKVIMITGDHVATASAIATQLGILDPDDPNCSRAIRGAELDTLSESQLASLKPFPSVFARVSPDNKLQIVKALQSRGELVAMTGDGVNDAPAIKAADVGVAMGIGGTDITKQAADIVLANDNFTTIVHAVEEGRRVFDNIQKFIVYLLSCNSAEIWLMLLCAIINRDLPFTAIVILYANIIADVPPAMAIGIEPPELDIMDRSPRDPKAHVIDRAALTLILVQGWSMSLITLFVYLMELGDARVQYASDGHEIPEPKGSSVMLARSEAFALLTTMQLFQGFLSRSTMHSVFRVNFFSNPYMVFAVILSFVGLFIGFYVPPIADWLGLYPINGIEWAKTLAGLAVHIFITEMTKLGLRQLAARRERKDVDALEMERRHGTMVSLTSANGIGPDGEPLVHEPSSVIDATASHASAAPAEQQRGGYSNVPKDENV